MSHDIASSIVLIDHGGDLLMAVKSASSNVSPRQPYWGMMMRRFENVEAAKGMLFANRLSGSLVFDSTLARMRRVGVEALDYDQKMALLRQDQSREEQALALYSVAEAIGDLERCVEGDYYSAEALALAERAVKALREGTPVPNPNDREWSQRKQAEFPILSGVSQHGLSSRAVQLLRDRADLALEVGPFGVTPLHRLAGAYAFAPDMMQNVSHGAKLLLELGADPRASDVMGRTPLHTLVSGYAPNPELANELVRAGANVNACDNEGHTPLHRAAGKNSLEIVELLLGLGADCEAVNHKGQKAADIARKKSYGAPLLARLELAEFNVHLGSDQPAKKSGRVRSL